MISFFFLCWKNVLSYVLVSRSKTDKVGVQPFLSFLAIIIAVNLFFPPFSDTCCSTSLSYQLWWVCPATSSSSVCSSSSATCGCCWKSNGVQGRWEETPVTVSMQIPLMCYWNWDSTSSLRSCPCCLQLRSDGLLSFDGTTMNNNQQEDGKDAASTKSQASRISTLLKLFSPVTRINSTTGAAEPPGPPQTTPTNVSMDGYDTEGHNRQMNGQSGRNESQSINNGEGEGVEGGLTKLPFTTNKYTEW